MAYMVIVGWACSMLPMAQGITFIGGGGGGVGWACPAADGAEHNLYRWWWYRYWLGLSCCRWRRA